ncbi:hypothetical protein Gbth_132_002 [Gluconobacter thailandicus F149-1 = NBRC 100600]|nr:hypothetical protein Gbth_132_002 [Gluconobacter thailandicus F149-1 = NBRC 100600]GEL88369.1 hypothetical protein GTH01_27270 [Gluconobacter thailandicus F149-1 = NBRC 100600]
MFYGKQTGQGALLPVIVSEAEAFEQDFEIFVTGDTDLQRFCRNPTVEAFHHAVGLR